MGVDCKINLPDNVRINDVAKVIGLSAGLKPKWNSSRGAKWIEVHGIEIKNTTIPQMAEIFVIGDLVDGEKHHFVYYHFESSNSGRELSPRSTAFWIAIAHRLIDFFGGSIDYNDCDDVYVNYTKPANSKDINSPEDDDEWGVFQERLSNVKPITEEELKHYDELASYKIAEMRGHE